MYVNGIGSNSVVAIVLLAASLTAAETERDTAPPVRDPLTATAPASLPSAATLQEWHLHKDRGGPTFSGSASWRSYMAFLEHGMRRLGVIDLKRDAFSYHRWYTSDDRNAGRWSLKVDGVDVEVASYWAYSGGTSPDGVTAPLVAYDARQPPGFFTNKIVVFEIPPSPVPPGQWFRVPGFEFATNPDSFPQDSMNTADTITYDQFYQLTQATLFGNLNRTVAEVKPAGALVVFDMSPRRAAGLYTFPLPATVLGAPGLYLDRVAGARIKAAMEKGGQATLQLLSTVEETVTYFLSGVLPGRNYGKESDEMVLVISHTDGPSLTQENGPLGILGVLQQLSLIAQESRPRSVLVLLDPSHFMPPGSAPDWYERNPELAARIVASLGIEHLGQVEYKELGNDYLPTGRPELAGLMVQDNDRLIEMAIKAVTAHRLPRTLVQSPPREGQGNWFGMGKVALERKIPGFGMMGYMGPYWATTGRIDKFDSVLMARQIAAMAQLTEELMAADLRTLAVPRAPMGDVEGYVDHARGDQ